MKSTHDIILNIDDGVGADSAIVMDWDKNGEQRWMIIGVGFEVLSKSVVECASHVIFIFILLIFKRQKGGEISFQPISSGNKNTKDQFPRITNLRFLFSQSVPNKGNEVISISLSSTPSTKHALGI